MKIVETRNRQKVEAIYKWSMQLTQEGVIEETKTWESKSPWHNSKFFHKETGQQWVLYLADHAWPGEVKLINTQLVNK
ncbi:MAG: hypothetical protein ACJAS1_007242 [Oleiphilaceae bacterium]|jgi:hypothetical protein